MTRRSQAPDALAIVERYLSKPGRLFGSKSAYTRRFPSRLVIFNANLLVRGVKVWWGDIDLTTDEAALVAIAREAGEVHVLRELDGRFQNEARPLVPRFAYWTDGCDRRIGSWEAHMYERRRGRIRRKLDAE